MSTWIPPNNVVKALGYLLERGLPLETCLLLLTRANIISLQEKLMLQAKIVCLDTERQRRRGGKPVPPGGGGGGLESPEERARRQAERRIRDNELVRKLYQLDRD